MALSSGTVGRVPGARFNTDEVMEGGRGREGGRADVIDEGRDEVCVEARERGG